MKLTTFLKAFLPPELQIAQENTEELERSQKTLRQSCMCASLTVTCFVSRKEEELNCCWEQWLCRVASVRVDLLPQQCESSRSPLRFLWELRTALEVLSSCQGIFCAQNVQSQEMNRSSSSKSFVLKSLSLFKLCYQILETKPGQWVQPLSLWQTEKTPTCWQ